MNSAREFTLYKEISGKAIGVLMLNVSGQAGFPWPLVNIKPSNR